MAKFSTSAIASRRKKDGKSGPISSLPPGMQRHSGGGGGFDFVKTGGKGGGGDGGGGGGSAQQLFKPVVVKPNPDDLNFGEELAGKQKIGSCFVNKWILT